MQTPSASGPLSRLFRCSRAWIWILMPWWAMAAKQPLLFVSTVEAEAEIDPCLTLCESIRTFGGALSQTPMRIYLPPDLLAASKQRADRARELSVDFRTVEVPRDAARFFFGRKPFAAAQAEAEAMGQFACVAWMNANSLVIKPPKQFLLQDGVAFAYAPVHHQKIGSPFDQPPDAFWTRLYATLDVPESAMFPMRTAADDAILRPYFSSGIFVFRPERGLMQRWAEDFTTLIHDSVFVDMCRQNTDTFIFLHQAALAGAVLHDLEHRELVALPSTYNYPVFFERFFSATSAFDSIEDVVTLRTEFRFKDLPSDWEQRLKGDPEVKAWIKERFCPKTVDSSP